MNNKKISIQYTFYVILAVLFTWIIHEFTHWATSELLGYESIMRINSVSSVDGKISSDLHKINVSSM